MHYTIKKQLKTVEALKIIYEGRNIPSSLEKQAAYFGKLFFLTEQVYNGRPVIISRHITTDGIIVWKKVVAFRLLGEAYFYPVMERKDKSGNYLGIEINKNWSMNKQDDREHLQNNPSKPVFSA